MEGSVLLLFISVPLLEAVNISEFVKGEKVFIGIPTEKLIRTDTFMNT